MEPFTLTPACKDYLWGGRRLKDDWGMRTDLEMVAEIWELSAHPAGDGIVADGPWAGRPFSEAVRAHPEIVSRRHGPDAPFPLLVKLIDARLPLSVQVHPDDAYAARVEHGPGKTEMWLVLDHEPGAFLYVGFERELTREELERRIGDGSLTDVLHRVEVRRGDRFFIPAGTIHAIGGGVLIAEVQQSSDLTYRVFDYGRTGPDGRPRPLHVAKALDVMRPGPADLAVPGASPAHPVPGGTLERLADCPYFRAEVLDLSGRWERTADGDTFHSLLCLDGTATLRAGSAVLSARKGASLFVPADAGPFLLEGTARFLITSLGGRGQEHPLSGGPALQFFISQVFSANFHELPLPSRHFPPANDKIIAGFQNFIPFLFPTPPGGLLRSPGGQGAIGSKRQKGRNCWESECIRTCEEGFCLIKKTPLNDMHHKLEGQLTDFGGWEMPLWYKAGAVKEHLFVVEKCGIFDICHMCLVRVTGKDAFGLLQLCLTRNIEKLAKGACGYTMILDEKAHVVDDCIVYNMNDNREDYLLVVNSNRASIVADHLKKHMGSFKADVKNEDGVFGKIDLQGPKSAEILRKVLEKGSIDGLKYFHFLGDYDAAKNKDVRLKGDIPVLLSRTGYTGELGFEILCPIGKTVDVWNALIAAGGDDILPCGLASRDSLRMGAILPLSQQDIGPWPFVHTPWDFALPRDKEGKLTKSFLGSTIYDNPPESYTLPYCGFDPRKVDAHHGARVLLDGKDIGVVTTCCVEVACSRVNGKIVSTASPDKPADFKPKGLVAGYVRVDRKLEPGTKITLKDDRRSIEVEVVSDIRPGRTARVAI